MRMKKRIFGLPFLTQERLEDGTLVYRLGGIRLRRVKARPMKLGVSYNLYDGEELLRASIRAIRSEVDFVTVVYQDVSNFGERREPLLPLLRQLKAEGLVDAWVAYEPDLKLEPRMNERRKRVLGLESSRSCGCDYHLDMDVDEFYRADELHRAKDFILSGGYDGTACWIENYLGSPEYLVLDRDDLFVPFIIRIPKRSARLYNGVYPVIADRTRTMRRNGTFQLLPRDLIAMHHMSLVRKNLERKLGNSTLNNQSVTVEAQAALKEDRRRRAAFVFGGHPVPGDMDFCGRDPVILVADEFEIGKDLRCTD